MSAGSLGRRLAALLLTTALAGPAAAAPSRPAAATGDSAGYIASRRAVFLLGPAAGYRLPAGRLEFGEREASRCLQCHGMPVFVARDSATGEILRLTVDSVTFHRSAHAALACTQCHPDVRAYPHTFESRRPRVGCDADCHARDAKGRPVRHTETMEEFRASVHRDGLTGDHDAPDCAYCHGAGDPHAGGRVKETLTPEVRLALCASCHEDRDRMAADSVDVAAVSSYRAGMHYKAFRLGARGAALCADCHDTHGVRAARDTASTTHARHLPATCAQKGCHPGAGPRFATSGTDHLSLVARRSRSVRVLGGLFAWAGGAVLLLFALGVLLDLQRPVGRALAVEAGAASAALVPRLSVAMRLQHGMLVGSFVLLALTGLPIRFPDVAWLRALNAFMGGWEGARAVHRVAAGLLLVTAVVHALYALARWSRARGVVAEAWPMLPSLRDAREAAATAQYHLRLRAVPPEQGRHEFRAKLHYLAVVWGTPVMALSGAVLWFALPLAERLPRSALALAALAHGEEALLAVAVVLVWHFYNVHYAPGRGLRFLTWLDGRVTRRHQRSQHALETPVAEGEPSAPAPPKR